MVIIVTVVPIVDGDKSRRRFHRGRITANGQKVLVVGPETALSAVISNSPGLVILNPDRRNLGLFRRLATDLQGAGIPFESSFSLFRGCETRAIDGYCREDRNPPQYHSRPQVA